MPLVIKMQERGSPSVNKIFDMQQGIRSEKYDAYVFSKVKNQPNVNSDVPSVERFKNIRMDLPSVHSIRIITAESKYRPLAVLQSELSSHKAQISSSNDKNPHPDIEDTVNRA
ncbi:uncharacterized [Tachysurus ichikawai]